MFKKILIANRGEIACRVMRTAHRMGIATVAVYSEADRDARHTAMADEAYPIGPAPAAESYLQGQRLIETAQRAGADAIHPGYGFLSENAAFARACGEAGVIFIGPAPETMEVMGSKSRAKDLMAKAGVPLSPGYQGEDQSVETFQTEAARIGYPVLLKAAAGGGGKGMRIVEDESALAEALASAKREAMSAFGDDRFLVEKFLTGPRHIEVQVFGDTHGNVVHLYERDCSVQRRYQKVIEEAPAPNLPSAVRDRLLTAGVEAARAVNYVGAGTVEFLYDGADSVFFMEMNTRLQVEHPVTEEVTGLDLVEWQIRVAAGEALPLDQDQIYCDGHAVEARLYAEDPAHDYRPSVGPAHVFSAPTGAGVRVDTGLSVGGVVTPHYDPMIAKVIAHDEDRGAALARLAQALSDFEIAPLSTNLNFLRQIVTHPVFVEGGVTTGFLTAYPAVATPSAPSPAVIGLALLAAFGEQGGFRVNGPNTILAFVAGPDGPLAARLLEAPAGWSAEIGEAAPVVLANVARAPGHAMAEVDGGRLAVTAERRGDSLHIRQGQDRFLLVLVDPGAVTGGGGTDAASLMSPMPSTVTGVAVEPGQTVSAGDVLMTLEAMKMEHLVKAPTDGVVGALHFAPGDTVPEGALLCAFEPSD